MSIACDSVRRTRAAHTTEYPHRHGVKDENIVVTTVPGALEIPGALVMLYEGYPDLDALVAIGCVIREKPTTLNWSPMSLPAA